MGKTMNNRFMMRLLWSGAIFFIVLGIVMTINSAAKMRKSKNRFTLKINQLKELRAMEKEINQYKTAMQVFEHLPSRHPVNIAKLARKQLSRYKMDEIRKTRKKSISGWTVRQNEIALTEIPLREVLEFLNKAQTQKPPWCLINCDIRASSRTAGAGRVVLLLQAMEKTGLQQK